MRKIFILLFPLWIFSAFATNINLAKIFIYDVYPDLENKPYKFSLVEDATDEYKAFKVYIFYSLLSNKLNSENVKNCDIQKKLLRYKVKLIDDYCFNVYVKKPLLKDAEKMAKDYYEKHKKEFFLPEQRQVRYIFFEVPPDSSKKLKEKKKKMAYFVYEKLKKGADFATLAKKYFESRTKTEGGLCYPFIKDKLTNKSFANFIFNMNLGEISKPVFLETGYFIIKLEKIIPPHQQSFEDVKRNLIYRFYSQKLQSYKYEFLKKMEKLTNSELFIERNNSKLKGNTPVFKINGKKYKLESVVPNYKNMEKNKLLSKLLFLYNTNLYLVYADKIGLTSNFNPKLKFYKKMLQVDCFVSQKLKNLKITEEDLKKFYRENEKMIFEPAKYEYAIITVYANKPKKFTPRKWHYAKLKAKKKIEKILEKIRNGANFFEMAKKYSDDSLAPKGGYGGWISFPFRARVDIPLSKLKIGEVSEPFENKDGYNIVKLLNKKPPKKIPFKKFKNIEKYRKIILNNKKRLFIKNWMEKIFKQSNYSEGKNKRII